MSQYRLVGLLVFLAIGSPVRPQSPELIVPFFQVSNQTMERALTQLHGWGIRVCLEKAAEDLDAPGSGRISVNLENTKVNGILDALVAADRRYAWERYKRFGRYANLINVFPSQARRDPDYIMNIKTGTVRMKMPGRPEELIPEIAESIPEIVNIVYPGGILGSSGRVIGGPVSLEVEFEATGLTVREILNELALRNVEQGWLYEYVKDAPPFYTKHRWRLFP